MVKWGFMSGIPNERRRTRVKICGITNARDAEMAIAAGADALGFNTHPGSKRFIDLEREQDWIRQLPPFVMRVAVAVDLPVAQAERLFALPFIDAVQFHGAEDASYCGHFAKLGLPFIKALALRDPGGMGDLGRFCTRQILLDAYSPEGFGGLGKLIDLEAAAEFSVRNPKLDIILSGGLTPTNVREAVRLVEPYAVDVASGVESAPGIKDPQLLADFVGAAQLY